MTLEEFRKEQNGAPCDEEEFAQRIMEIDDCEKLTDVVHTYLEATEAYRCILDDFELEIE